MRRFAWTIKFLKDQPQVLIIGEVIINPVYEGHDLVLYTKDQKQVKAHPDQPGKEAT